MNIFQAVILGVVQGITEFFPISSSGHLVICQGLFGLKAPMLAFDIFLHTGTLFSILVVFAKDILELFGRDKRTLFLLAVASVPTFIIAFFFKDSVEALFGMPNRVGYMMIVTGVWLVAATLYSRYAKDVSGKNDNGIRQSIVIGIAQGIAIIPGISRSGSTIATGMLSGLKRETAVRFSLLLAIPTIAAASLLKAGKIGLALAADDAGVFLAGGVVAMLVGIFAIRCLLKLVRENRLYIFGIYCFIVGTLVAVFYR